MPPTKPSVVFYFFDERSFHERRSMLEVEHPYPYIYKGHSKRLTLLLREGALGLNLLDLVVKG